MLKPKPKKDKPKPYPDTATMHVVPTGGAYIQAGASSLYAFRIDIKSNPASTPLFNYWTIEYQGESTQIEDMKGFTLRTFTETSIKPVSTARNHASVSDKRDIPIRLKFRPYKTITPHLPVANSGGVIAVTAPTDFEFAQSGGACTRIIIKALKWLPPDHGAVEQPELTWLSNDARCVVQNSADGRANAALLVYLNSDRGMDSGRDFEVYLDVALVPGFQTFRKLAIRGGCGAV